MLTRRELLLGAAAAAATIRTPIVFAKASQPSTPVNFDVPRGISVTGGPRSDYSGFAPLAQALIAANSDRIRGKILVDNPARLYGF